MCFFLPSLAMTIVPHEPIENDEADLSCEHANQLPKGINAMKSKNATILRSLSTSKLLTGMLAIGLILPNTGCRLGKSKDQPGVSWRDWMPRSLVRAPAEADQASTETPSANAVTTNVSDQTDLQDIAPLPPKAESQTLPMAPMPANDLPELVAIDNDLPDLETTPAETSDADETVDTEKETPKDDSFAQAPSPEALLLEEAPLEEAPVEEAPAEEAPAEEAPAEEAPAEDDKE